ncbi:conserved Plasmodium protein, unknown function [Plasmodium gallinaceum]|uniref:Uncharacterized protein n=1 Tax=Plasmodium gallinaceum TaxID=5849 RepID=A0A1J1GNU4_PLAGA|nr:conserved Plasmodium protein, unknown function [Plasmodium gallinaceum]CRG94151.1 conserved Plasmodium protein, unknown function [Plasmodium gallinaceum]
MCIKIYSNSLLMKRSNFSTLKNLFNSSFNVYTNKYSVSSKEFFNDVYLMNKKLLYYINDYFKLNDESNYNVKKIGSLFPPCYSQLISKFCILMNNFDFISIPTPIKKSIQIKEKYAFFLSENNTSLILCHPFYKHYIEEISFNLQIPFLICYDKPDILSHEEYLEDLQEGKENFSEKFLYDSKKYEKYKNKEKELLNEMKNIYFNNGKIKNKEKTNEKHFIEKWEELKDKNNVSIHLQLSKENECDKSIKFLLSNIFNQSKNFNKIMKFNEKDNVLLCIPPNNIQYFDIIFSVIHAGGTIVFPEVNKNKLINNNDYMKWFKNNMKKKNNNFSIHNLIIKNDFINSDFYFIDALSLFEEIQQSEKFISVLVCNNYLIRDFIFFFENSEINNITKNEFINNKASNVRIILINGNEIMPGINKKYLEKIKKIFINAKIYQRYVIQEIGTVCLMELSQLEDENIKYERNIAGYLLPDINIKIDSKTNILKIKSDNLFTEYYNNNNVTSNSFDENGFFKTKYIVSIKEDSLLRIEGIHNEIKNLPEEYYLYFKQRRDKMEKLPPGYLKRVRLHGQIWGNFHANKKNWKRKF